jgi:hypothetical protein
MPATDGVVNLQDGHCALVPIGRKRKAIRKEIPKTQSHDTTRPFRKIDLMYCLLIFLIVVVVVYLLDVRIACHGITL